MIIVRELPQKYEAIQFDMAFASKYGLIKYPMLKRVKRSVYGDTHKHVPISPSWIAPSNDTVVCIGDSPVEGFNRETGVVQMRDSRGRFAVKAPAKQQERSGNWLTNFFKEPLVQYDFDAPELHECIYHYYLGNTKVNNKDWIVTDTDGKSKVYSPQEFKERFVLGDKGATNEE